MRNTKLAWTVGLSVLALYGCGDGSGSKKDSGADALSVATKSDAGTATSTTTSTGTVTSTLTQTGTQTSTTTATGTRVDGSAGVDVASPPPVDGGAGDAPLVVPVDSGTPLDGTQAFDVGVRVDSGAAIDGSAGADVPVKNDGGAAAGKCDYPKCLLDLAKDCAPEGACVQQTTLPTGGGLGPWTSTSAACYENGVKMLVSSTYSIDLTSLELAGTTTNTWKKASGVCYSMETAYSAITPTSVTYVIRNAAGATVGTMAADTTANTQTITCTGEAPVVLPLNCESADAGAVCTTGSCTF